jgi:hypothetical protein
MKVTIITSNGRKYEHKNITNVIERTSGTSNKTWLVLKKQSHKNVASDVIAEKDFLKVALDMVESIRYD